MAVLVMTAPACVEAADPKPPRQSASLCRIDGWSADPDPAGLRVRAAPSVKAKVLARLPAYVPPDPRDDGDYGPGFDIDAARDGWLHISNARDSWAPADRRRPTYRGAGWVHGSLVKMRIEGRRGRAGPLPGSPVVVDAGDESISDVGHVTGVLDCAGKQAKLAYRIDPGYAARGARRGVAWFDHVCGEQRTTCTR